MGIFDSVYIESGVTLPEFDGDVSDLVWQTKTFYPARDRYKITADGKLLTDRYRREVDGWTNTAFHGTFEFYARVEGELFEYVASFVDGNLDEVNRIHKRGVDTERVSRDQGDATEDTNTEDDDRTFDVEFANESLKETVEEEIGLPVDEFKQLVGENVDAAKPILTPPLEGDEIEAIEDDELRALAWHLDAIATAYNYASDPTLPDILADQEEDRTELRPDEEIHLNEACDLLEDTYKRIYDRVGDDLKRYKRDDE